MFTDTHCHIFNEYYENIKEILERAKNVNINRVINNGCDAKSNIEVLELIKKYPNMYGAAEMAVPQLSDVLSYLNQVKIRLNNSMTNKIKKNKQKLIDLRSRNIFKNPASIYQTKEMIFDNTIEKLKHALINLTSIKEKELLRVKNSFIMKNPHKILDKKSNKYLQIISKLDALSPLKTLKRGYTITKLNNKVVNSCKDLNKNDEIKVTFDDGEIEAKVL